MAELRTPLKSILNFRDVGHFVNESTGTRYTPQVADLHSNAADDEPAT